MDFVRTFHSDSSCQTYSQIVTDINHHMVVLVHPSIIRTSHLINDKLLDECTDLLISVTPVLIVLITIIVEFAGDNGAYIINNEASGMRI